MNELIYVLYGGISNEREVSIRSGVAVIGALRESELEAVGIDVSMLENVSQIPERSLVLPILHGTFGEDGVVQSILEKKNCKYLGSDSGASKKCFDKNTTREILAIHNINIANGDVLNSLDEYRVSELSSKPHVLKIANGGSSLGTLIVRDPQNLSLEKVQLLFKIEPKVIIEELIEGVEITVPILGNTALPVIEIIPPINEEFDYQNKYNGLSQEICPSASLIYEKQNEAQELAKQVHEIMNCRHISRVDMIVEKNGRIVILEINTIPGLTETSLYPLSAAVAGYSMKDLVKEFVKMSMESTG